MSIEPKPRLPGFVRASWDRTEKRCRPATSARSCTSTSQIVRRASPFKPKTWASGLRTEESCSSAASRARSCADARSTPNNCERSPHDNVTALEHIPAEKIVRALADAAERWSDADFPPRVRITDRIAERTGYSVPVVEYALDRLFFPIRRANLESTIRSELGSLEILDDFTQRTGRPDAWAAPCGNVCIISSRTTIGVALVPAVFALCAKNDVLVKDREDALVHAFFETLAQELDAFADAARASTWASDDETAPELETFDAVAAFGSDDTLVAIRSALNPGARFIGYGSRASAGYVTREVLANRNAVTELCRGAARDLVLYETEGCLSLH